ncbi:aldo/keto reductase [Streptomyces sp. NPDC058008]|uniref:aldo/keto reductase n=1 Tax=Streptomyces sp. NPDC058008 TaxID=3346303 RepID=UPI0036ED928E
MVTARRRQRLRASRSERSEEPLESPTIAALAERYGKAAAQIILRRHLQAGRSAIPKSVKEHRVREHFGVSDVELTESEVALLTEALDPRARRRGSGSPR